MNGAIEKERVMKRKESYRVGDLFEGREGKWFEWVKGHTFLLTKLADDDLSFCELHCQSNDRMLRVTLRTLYWDFKKLN